MEKTDNYIQQELRFFQVDTSPFLSLPHQFSSILRRQFSSILRMSTTYEALLSSCKDTNIFVTSRLAQINSEALQVGPWLRGIK